MRYPHDELETPREQKNTAGRGLGNFSDRAWNLFTSPKDCADWGCADRKMCVAPLKMNGSMGIYMDLSILDEFVNHQKCDV